MNKAQFSIPNYDENTGMHYGAISANNVTGEIWNDFNPVYITECPTCGNETTESECPTCGANFEDIGLDYSEPSYQEWNGENEYALEYSESINAFIITKSPFYTVAAPCSPCVPNAGDLDTPRENGIETYCLDHSFFDTGRAPYLVYNVATNELVLPKGI